MDTDSNSSGMSSVTVTNLQQDIQDVQSMNLIFGGALIILSIVVTGIVCVLGNIPIPYFSKYYSPEITQPSMVVQAHSIPQDTAPATSTRASVSSSTVSGASASSSASLP